MERERERGMAIERSSLRLQGKAEHQLFALQMAPLSLSLFLTAITEQSTFVTQPKLLKRPNLVVCVRGLSLSLHVGPRKGRDSSEGGRQ